MTTTTAVQAILADVFQRQQTIPPVSQAEEVALIAEAKAGSSDAIAHLIRLYAPALRNETKRHRETLDTDETQGVILAAFVEAVNLVPAGERLATVIVRTLRSALGEAASSNAHAGFSVPSRTVKRFFAILRAAEGNVSAAAALAPAFEMTRETFFAVLDAVRMTGSMEDREDVGSRWKHGATDKKGGSYDATDYGHGILAEPLWAAQQIADAEARDLVALAFSAVDPTEADVCRLAYGFADFDPVPDAEIAHRLGFSRPKAQRIRAGALDKMRAAVGA